MKKFRDLKINDTIYQFNLINYRINKEILARIEINLEFTVFCSKNSFNIVPNYSINKSIYYFEDTVIFTDASLLSGYLYKFYNETKKI